MTKPFDLKVTKSSTRKLVSFCKCRRCGYVFRSSDYWRRRGGWARGKVEKLMKKCIKCGHGKFYFHSQPWWNTLTEMLSDNALDSSLRLMEIAESSEMHKVKQPWKLGL